VATLTDLKRLQPGIYYTEHSTRKRDSINKDRKWVVKQKLGGKIRVSVLGWEKLDGKSLGDAIKKAELYKSNFAWNKENPEKHRRPICKAEEEKLLQDRSNEIPTLNDFYERYLIQHVEKKLKPATAKEYRRQFEKNILPIFGDQRIIDIERKQIVKFVEDISVSAPVMANRILATLKGLFTYAVKVGVISISPATKIDLPGKENEKDRILDLKEIATMFTTLEEYNNRDTADIMRLITLTGLRPGEVAEMRLLQIESNDNETWLTLKKADTKNKKEHRTFLNNLAVKTIQDRIHDLNLKHYIFPAKTQSGFMRKDVLVRRLSATQSTMQENGIEPFTAHDLRRSAATGIAKLDGVVKR
jgi:integrase